MYLHESFALHDSENLDHCLLGGQRNLFLKKTSELAVS